jgi:hypothetical protein
VGTEQGVACRKRECKRVWLQRWMQLEVIAIALADDDASKPPPPPRTSPRGL